MILIEVIAYLIQITVLILWLTGIIPGAIEKYKKFKYEMDETHNRNQEDKT